MSWEIRVRASDLIQTDNRLLNVAEDVKPVVDAIRRCKPLRELCLEGFSYGVAAAECIGGALAECGSGLRLALWSDMFVSRTKEEVPVALASLMDGLIKSGAKLKLLDLSNNAFGAQGVQSLVAYFKSPLSAELEDLYITNTGLGVGGAKVLSAVLWPHLTDLKTLKIGRNRLENEGSIALAAVLKKFSNLEALEMPQNGIYYKGFEALAQVLEANRNIQELIFSDNTIGPKGSKALKQVLPKLDSLSCLCLDDCLLKNQGAKYILEALLPPNNSLLTVLNLSANEISDKISEKAIKDAICSRSNLQCDLLDNRLSKAFRDHLLTDADMMCELSFGEEEDLEDYYDEDDDDEDDEDLEEGEEDDEEEDYDEEDDFQEEIYIEHEDLSTDEEQAVNLSYIPTTVNKEDDLPCKEFDDVLAFLKETNKENFTKLGSNPTEALIRRLESIKDEEEYTDELVKMIFKMNIVEQNPKEIFSNMNSWEKDDEHRSSILANGFLVHLGVMKSEDKKKVLCGNAEQCLKSFSKSLNSSDFSPKLRDTIMFAVKDKCARESKIGCIDSKRFLELLSNGKN